MRNFIVNKLQTEADEQELLNWWNEYDDETTGGEGKVLGSLEEWSENLDDDCLSFAYRVFYGDIHSLGDSYFWLNGYSNFISSNSLVSGDGPVDFSELAGWLIEGKPSYIQDWIAEWEEMNAEGAED